MVTDFCWNTPIPVPQIQRDEFQGCFCRFCNIPYLEKVISTKLAHRLRSNHHTDYLRFNLYFPPLTQTSFGLCHDSLNSLNSTKSVERTVNQSLSLVSKTCSVFKH